MKEIKFRAWYKPVTGYGQMIEVEQLNFSPNIEGVIVNDLPRQKYIWALMQYTGLKDKNGKEIYEGDVVTLWNGLYDLKEHYVVRWYQFGFDYSNPSNPTETHYFPQDKIEVIGNIYENPELLEPKSEELAS